MSRYARTRHLKQLLVPTMFVLSIPVLLRYLTANVAQADAMARGLAGPISWPRFALYGVLFCAVGWLLQTIFNVWRQLGTDSDIPAETSFSKAHLGQEIVIWIGIALTLLYGFLIPVVGYPAATLGYIVLWLLLGGIRKPVLISLVALCGTVFLLYMFVKLALMPLDRGQGAFGEFTIAIYRLLGIY